MPSAAYERAFRRKLVSADGRGKIAPDVWRKLVGKLSQWIPRVDLVSHKPTMTPDLLLAKQPTFMQNGPLSEKSDARVVRLIHSRE